MKIKTQRDINLLTEKIRKDFDIDINKYRNDEVVATFTELLILPQYILNWGIRPILIAIILFVVSYFFIDLANIFEYIIYTILGSVLFLICGIFSALVFLIRRMKSDLGSIINYSLDILKEATEDIGDFSTNFKQKDKKEGIKLLYLGIMHIVTIPSVTGAIKRKNTFIGYPLAYAVKKLLTIVGNTVTVQDLETSVYTSSNSISMDYDKDVKVEIETQKNFLQRTIDIAISIIEFPFKFAFVIALMFLIGLIYLIH